MSRIDEKLLLSIRDRKQQRGEDQLFVFAIDKMIKYRNDLLWLKNQIDMIYDQKRSQRHISLKELVRSKRYEKCN